MKATNSSTCNSPSPPTPSPLNALEIDFYEVTITAAGQTQTATVSLDDKRETATFTVRMPLQAGSASIHVTYTGHLNDKLRGLYLSTNNGRKYAVTQMEATDARAAFPSFPQGGSTMHHSLYHARSGSGSLVASLFPLRSRFSPLQPA